MPLSEEARQRLRSMGTKGRTVSSIAEQMTDEGIPDPLAGMVYTGDLEIDLHAELNTLMLAFETAAGQEPPDWEHTSRSAIWAPIVFLSRKDKDWFLMTVRIFEMADKYVTIEDWQWAMQQLQADGPKVVDYKPWKPPVWTTNTDGEPITEQQLKYRQAAARATYLMRMQADSEMWICLCFRTHEQRNAWLAEHPPIAGTKYHDGYHVAESIGIDIPREEV